MKKKNIFFSLFLLFMLVIPIIVYAGNEYKSGMYKVGVDISSGEYILFAENGKGYFSVSSDSNQKDILFNDNFDYNSIVTVQEGEYLKLSRCYAVPFSKDVNVYTSKTGMFKVGAHIPAGEYKLEAGNEKGYYCIYSDSRHGRIIANDNFDGQTYVTVSDGQYLLLNRCNISTIPTVQNNTFETNIEREVVIDQGTIILDKDNLQPVLGTGEKRNVYIKECRYTPNQSDICIVINEDAYFDKGKMIVQINSVSIDDIVVEYKNNYFGTPTNGTFNAKFFVSLEELQKYNLTDFEKMTCDISVSMINYDKADVVYETELEIMRDAFIIN